MKPHDFSTSPAPSPDDSAWENLAAAYQRRVAKQATGDDSAPFGFAQRVVAHGMALRRQAGLSWWTRWSLRAAFGALMVAALVTLRSPSSGPGTSLLKAPALEIPGLSSL